MEDKSKEEFEGQDCETECTNGSVGYHQPSHVLTIEPLSNDKVDTKVDKNGHTYVYAEKCANVDPSTMASVGLNDKKDGSSKNKTDNLNVTTRTKTLCHRQWSLREKYLLIVSILLFLCCIAFVLVAFAREHTKKDTCGCKGKKVVNLFSAFG